MCGAVDDLQAEALFAELAILADAANLARLRQVLAELTGATGCRCAPNWSSFDTPAEHHRRQDAPRPVTAYPREE